MANFASNNVHIYPISTTRNLNVDKGARDTYLSEYAITNLLKASVDRKNYVIDSIDSQTEGTYSTSHIDFVLDGYIFNLDIPNDLQSGNLYVKLSMKYTSETHIFPEVKSDNGTNFEGLEYITSFDGVNNTNEWFQLLSNGKVPDESTVKIDIAKSTDFFLDYKIIVDGNGFTSDNSISTPDNSIFTYESRNGETIITGLKENINTESLYIPSNIIFPVTSIGDYAFKDCIKLMSVTIPDSIESIGEDAFKGCTGLTEVNINDLSAWCNIDFVNYSSNPLYYAHNLYINNDLATDIVIPSDIISIGDFTFDSCFSLQNIIIPDSVTNIGRFAFSHCDNLTSIPIPEGVTRIDFGAFSYCSNLTSITYTGTISQWQSIAFGTMWNEGTGSYIIHCTDGNISKDGTITYV